MDRNPDERKADKPKKERLVLRHLEFISRKALKNYQDIVFEHIGGGQGVFALHGDGRLYYVGLLQDLKGRLGSLLEDWKWDTFSIYIVNIERFSPREFENLILKLALPEGNRQPGAFAHSQDLKPDFRRKVALAQQGELARMLGEEKDTKAETGAQPGVTKAKKGRRQRGRKKAAAPQTQREAEGVSRQGGTVGPAGKEETGQDMATEPEIAAVPSPKTATPEAETQGSETQGSKTQGSKTPSAKGKQKGRSRKSVLSPYVKNGFEIRFWYKGRVIKANVEKNGSITYLGKSYSSPSLAAAEVTGRVSNGWTFWKYERSPGEWVLLDELRGKRQLQKK